MATSIDRATLALTEEFLRLYPGEAARQLESLPVTEIVGLLEGMSRPNAAVLERLTPQVAAWVLEEMSDEAAHRALSALDPGRAASLLARLDEKARDRRLDSLEEGLARELRTLMTFPEGSAGQLMERRMATAHPDTTAAEALERLRRLRDRPTHHIYLVDQQGQLVGSVALQDLALAAPHERLRELVRREPVSVQAMAPVGEVVELLGRRRLTSVPVVDFEGSLLGVIRHDALLTAAEEAASADMQTMVGASKEERALSRVGFAVRKRLPWLQVNLATAFLAAAVVGIFEETIARFTALAVLLPVVAGQSGNTGAQALAVTMRGLALREVRPRHWPRLTLKEVNVAFINGLAVALTTAVGVYVWSRSLGLALVIGTSMVISMVVAGLSGASIPVVLIKLGQDPAQASSIILTTATDVVGFLSFLGIATLLAGIL
jgi:magnesium transporter